MFQKEVYLKRREELKTKVSGGIILLPGNEQSSISYQDNWYPFRQDSSFLYFTGIDQPSLALLIDIDTGTETLFGDDLSVEDVIWNGPQPSVHELAAKAGIEQSTPLSNLGKMLESAQKHGQQIHFLPPYRPEHSAKFNSWLNLPVESLKASASVQLIKAIVALRSIKSPEEIEEIKKAVGTTEEMQMFAMRSARQGMTEAGIAGALQGLAIAAGGNLSFPTILTTRGEILHNHYSNNLVPAAQMILLDCGAETAMHYAGDLTRTFPVDKKFTTDQKEIYNIVLLAKQVAADALKPGTLYRDIHFLACEKLVEGLQQIGLMKGDVKEAVAAGAHTLFFQCGLGHMMGLDVHDMENLGEEWVGYNDDLKKSTDFGLKSLRLGKPLEAGFVLTVEPGLYFIPELIDMWAAEKRHHDFINYNQLAAFRNFGGIRIEDDFVITENGSELLSASLPGTAEEIEAIRSEIQ